MEKINLICGHIISALQPNIIHHIIKRILPERGLQIQTRSSSPLLGEGGAQIHHTAPSHVSPASPPVPLHCTKPHVSSKPTSGVLRFGCMINETYWINFISSVKVLTPLMLLERRNNRIQGPGHRLPCKALWSQHRRLAQLLCPPRSLPTQEAAGLQHLELLLRGRSNSHPTKGPSP